MTSMPMFRRGRSNKNWRRVVRVVPSQSQTRPSPLITLHRPFHMMAGSGVSATQTPKMREWRNSCRRMRFTIRFPTRIFIIHSQRSCGSARKIRRFRASSSFNHGHLSIGSLNSCRSETSCTWRRMKLYLVRHFCLRVKEEGIWQVAWSSSLYTIARSSFNQILPCSHSHRVI